MPANSRWDLIRRLRVNANESAAVKAVSETTLGSILGKLLAPAFPRAGLVLHVLLTAIQKFNVYGSVHRNNILVYNSN